MEEKSWATRMIYDSVYIHEMNCVTPLGSNLEDNWSSLLRGEGGLGLHHIGTLSDLYAAKIDDKLLLDLCNGDNTRLENMLISAMLPILNARTLTERTAFVLSTTKGNISSLEVGNAKNVELSRLAKKVAVQTGVMTEPIVVSHACVSGLLALFVAKRLIQSGLYDDAIVLAADELTAFVASGFSAFQAMSPFPCRPFDRDRAGVSLGEASACLYVSKEIGNYKILGEGSVNDANHISGPSRTGEGLVQSVTAAASEADVDLTTLDYISAHGTATAYNDEMEAIAFNRLGLQAIPVNSLKGYYGHTLGASGLLETVLALKGMTENLLIPTLGFREHGVSQPLNIVKELQTAPIRRLLKTASGFGGSNAAVIIDKVC
ncbi:beta-ketoacyl synthase N-terminal-like domain-containing protein [Sphingobacterium sp. LRF_L2]|uniref:beta-ketoacyl synthase N-terminal-like domain-containing protein n=1 Tax=Sphingobacterium sp. LRF_L2 TaxID=3369421 RepID=UPI003F5F40BF